MKVFLEPTGLHSRAMVRVAGALRRTAPAGIHIVNRSSHSDLQILHVISHDAIDYARGLARDYAVIQYCRCVTELGDISAWLPMWRGARVVWSYYLPPEFDGSYTYYHAPLGIDQAFLMPFISYREKLVVTHGYVHGPGAEAILEVWQAAERLGFTAVHVGPHNIEGMPRPPKGWHNVQGITDEQLARLFRRAAWVANLRYVEGFEMPAIEALSCGARPIVFDQPSMRYWYGGLASYVSESSPDLVSALMDAMSWPRPVTPAEIADTRRRFDWAPICREFWNHILHSVRPEQSTTAASACGILEVE